MVHLSPPRLITHACTPLPSPPLTPPSSQDRTVHVFLSYSLFSLYPFCFAFSLSSHLSSLTLSLLSSHLFHPFQSTYLLSTFFFPSSPFLFPLFQSHNAVSSSIIHLFCRVCSPSLSPHSFPSPSLPLLPFHNPTILVSHFHPSFSYPSLPLLSLL